VLFPTYFTSELAQVDSTHSLICFGAFVSAKTSYVGRLFLAKLNV